MIGHAIINDLNINEFRSMAILGMCLFYCGKQKSYHFYGWNCNINGKTIKASSYKTDVDEKVLQEGDLGPGENGLVVAQRAGFKMFCVSAHYQYSNCFFSAV